MFVAMSEGCEHHMATNNVAMPPGNSKDMGKMPMLHS